MQMILSPKLTFFIVSVNLTQTILLTLNLITFLCWHCQKSRPYALYSRNPMISTKNVYEG